MCRSEPAPTIQIGDRVRVIRSGSPLLGMTGVVKLLGTGPDDRAPRLYVEFTPGEPTLLLFGWDVERVSEGAA